jgi:hypothetical protein
VIWNAGHDSFPLVFPGLHSRRSVRGVDYLSTGTKNIMKTPEQKLKQAEYRKQYRLTHGTKMRESRRKYQLEHPDRVRESYKKYRIAHRDERNTKSRVYNALHRAERKAYRTSHKKEINAYLEASIAHRLLYSQTYRANHREKLNAMNRAHYAAHPVAVRGYKLKNKYGISTREFNVLLETQGGVCAVCKKDGWNGKAPHIDHDHVTKKVRGLLCFRCNMALGFIGDDPKIAVALAEYLIARSPVGKASVRPRRRR